MSPSFATASSPSASYSQSAAATTTTTTETSRMAIGMEEVEAGSERTTHHHQHHHHQQQQQSNKQMKPHLLRGNEAKSLGETYSEQMDLSLKELQEREIKSIPSFLLIHNGDMRITIKREDATDILQKIDNIVEDIGEGYYQEKSRHSGKSSRHSMDHNSYTGSSSMKKTKQGDETIQMTIRVRSDTFHHVIAEIRSLAYFITSLSTSSRDVTDEYVDSSARADVLEVARSSLQSVMSKADSVEDILSVQSELNRLTESIESLRQRAQSLKKQSEYSTLSLEVYIQDDEANFMSPKSWSPFQAAFRALHEISEFATELADSLIYITIWCIPFAVFIYLFYLIAKKFCWSPADGWEDWAKQLDFNGGPQPDHTIG